MKKTLKFLIIICIVGILILLGFKFIKNNNSSTNVDNSIESNLNSLGYTKKEINILKKKLDDNILSNIDNKDEFLIDAVNNKYFISDNLNRYKEYKNKYNNYSIEDVIMYVNIGIDNEFYTNIQEVQDPNDLLVLSNKYYSLPSTYEPQDLEEVNNSGRYMRSEAAKNMSVLQEDAKKDGIKINMISGYRSYDYQSGLYQKYVNRDGVKEADTYSARPGHSEHQTGLAMDVSDETWTCEEYFEDTEQFEWLSNNAYKYGFILRYPKDKEFITGYVYEPWHYRYVGVEVASIIHKENITLEEYYVKYVNEY